MYAPTSAWEPPRCFAARPVGDPPGYPVGEAGGEGDAGVADSRAVFFLNCMLMN